ncbi:MAG TPA: hypothetical protein VHM30_00780 [Gemmatimonadaceae bacterium]|nr:hypothetical protein [Gemmatimonadaceae bacterium]
MRTRSIVSPLLTFLAFSTLLLPSSARAQEAVASALVPGARVRIHVERPEGATQKRATVLGTIVARTEDRLLVSRANAAPAVVDTIPLFTVERMELSAGMEPRTKFIVGGMAIGALVSGGALLLARATTSTECNTQGIACEKKRDKWGGASPSIYLVPVALGGVIGFIVPRERWTRVPKSQLSVGVSGRGAMGRVRVAFR